MPVLPVGMVVAIAGVLWLGWWEWKQKKTVWIGLGAAWFGGMLLPVSGVVPINGLLYEHWLYVPMVGVGVAAYGVWRMAKRTDLERLQDPFLKVMRVVVGVYVLLTWRQNYIWGEPVRFYEYTLKHGKAARLHNNLGMAYADAGKFEEALGQYERALATGEVYPQVHHNLGNVLLELNDVERAEESYRQAIEMSPGFFPAYGPLINIYIEQQKYAEALPYVKGLWQQYPDNGQYGLIYGQALWKLGKKQEAEVVFADLVKRSGGDVRVGQIIEGIRGGQ